MTYRPKFEVWDQKRGERTSCAATEAEARKGCLNDWGRLLTITTGDGFFVTSYRDGKELTDKTALASWDTPKEPQLDRDGRDVFGIQHQVQR
jgi:hypothetical protein